MMKRKEKKKGKERKERNGKIKREEEKTTNSRKNRKEVDVVAVKHVSQSTRLDQLRLQGTIQKHFRYADRPCQRVSQSTGSRVH